MSSRIAQARTAAQANSSSQSQKSTDLLHELLKKTQVENQAETDASSPIPSNLNSLASLDFPSEDFPSEQNLEIESDPNSELAALTQILDEVEANYQASSANKEMAPTLSSSPDVKSEPVIENQAESISVPENKVESAVESAAESKSIESAPSNLETAAEYSSEEAEKQEIARLEAELQALASQSQSTSEIISKAPPPTPDTPPSEDNNIIVQLPLTQVQLKEGEVQPPSSSLRWLVEITKKLQKRFKGRAVFPDVEIPNL